MLTRDELAVALRASRRALLSAASGLTAEQAMRRPAEGEWSVVEVLAHLVDTDLHYAAEAIAMRDNATHMLVYFDDEAWKASHAGVREQPLPDVLKLLAASHEAVLVDLASMSESDLAAPGRHPRGIPYTVRDVWLRLPRHDDDHTRQIEKIVALI